MILNHDQTGIFPEFPKKTPKIAETFAKGGRWGVSGQVNRGVYKFSPTRDFGLTPCSSLLETYMLVITFHFTYVESLVARRVSTITLESYSF